jgi:transcriptional regulator with XRE-family HTH domain
MRALPANDFGALLKDHRFAARLNQSELAERANLSTQAVSALERGYRRAPHRTSVDLLARALGLTDDERALFAAAAATARRRGPRSSRVSSGTRKTDEGSSAGSFWTLVSLFRKHYAFLRGYASQDCVCRYLLEDPHAAIPTAPCELMRA